VQPWVNHPTTIQAPDGAAENQRTDASFAPSGAKFILSNNPTADAVGYYLSPSPGFGLKLFCRRDSSHSPDPHLAACHFKFGIRNFEFGIE
jgi:hypothetical protein